MRPKHNKYGEDKSPLRNPDAQVVKIPEDRIADECIGFVSELSGLSENVVRKIHDFQWNQVKEATDTYRTIHVSKLFKLTPARANKIDKFIEKITEQKDKYQQEYDQENTAPDRKWYLAHDIRKCNEQIEMLYMQLGKCSKKKL